MTRSKLQQELQVPERAIRRIAFVIGGEPYDKLNKRQICARINIGIQSQMAVMYHRGRMDNEKMLQAHVNDFLSNGTDIPGLVQNSLAARRIIAKTLNCFSCHL